VALYVTSSDNFPRLSVTLFGDSPWSITAQAPCLGVLVSPRL
jgi:hypothetical protein